MCLAIPAKVMSINEKTALVAIGEVEYQASLLLFEDVHPSDFVMSHAGFAIEKINPERAKIAAFR